MIEIDHVSRSFGALRAVDDLCLTVPRGELFCILGPNGAGKTTTIRMLTGLLRPDHGRLRIGGIDVVQEPVAARRIMGYVPDMPFLYERLTPAEFFQFTGELFGVPPADITREERRIFGLFGLLEQRAALIKDLSHGMRQRLIYAATFLHNPRVLFIDEPLIGLDPYTIRLLKNLLVRKAREGMTIFLTTHILSLAEDIADRIGIIYGGRLIALGTRAELLKAHQSERLEDMFLKLTGRGGDALADLEI